MIVGVVKLGPPWTSQESINLECPQRKHLAHVIQPSPMLHGNMEYLLLYLIVGLNLR